MILSSPSFWEQHDSLLLKIRKKEGVCGCRNSSYEGEIILCSSSWRERCCWYDSPRWRERDEEGEMILSSSICQKRHDTIPKFLRERERWFSPPPVAKRDSTIPQVFERERDDEGETILSSSRCQEMMVPFPRMMRERCCSPPLFAERERWYSPPPVAKERWWSPPPVVADREMMCSPPQVFDRDMMLSSSICQERDDALLLKFFREI